MARQYTKVEELSEAVFARKANGETNREIAESYRLELQQINIYRKHVEQVIWQR